MYVIHIQKGEEERYSQVMLWPKNNSLNMWVFLVKYYFMGFLKEEDGLIKRPRYMFKTLDLGTFHIKVWIYFPFDESNNISKTWHGCKNLESIGGSFLRNIYPSVIWYSWFGNMSMYLCIQYNQWWSLNWYVVGNAQNGFPNWDVF